jgi:hypothetical protein
VPGRPPRRRAAHRDRDAAQVARLREHANPAVLILDHTGGEMTARQADGLYELTNNRASPITDDQ